MSRFLPVVCLLVWAAGVRAGTPDEQFEKVVRPLLAEKCYGCHGEKKQKGDLRLDSLDAMLKGGQSGPAVVPGKPEQSLIVTAVRHNELLKMPPKEKLPAADIAALAAWVKAGATWPDAKPVTPTPATPTAVRTFTEEEKAFWAFQPVRTPQVPTLKPAVPHAIDAFLRAKLAEQGLQPAPRADRRTLIRRVTFDLTGLPPTAAEVEAFEKDTSPEAWDKLVNRLLASPAYGEKWGRRWLDVARYADSNGMDENLAHGNAWRYRDYVINSFNADKPFNQFVQEQIAGDLLPGGTPADRAERLTATGFLVIGPKMLAEDDPMKMRMDIVDEQLDTLGQAFLGLTLGCARCHDHKFDPLTQADYYALAGMFFSTKSMQSYGVVARWHERPIGSAESVAKLAEFEKQLVAVKAAATAAQQLAAQAVAGIGPTSQFAARLRDRTAALEKTRPRVDEVMAVEDDKGQDLRIHLRGSHLTLGAAVSRRFPIIVAGEKQAAIGSGSGRRELAEWVAGASNPLTPRVMANRIWLGHFGTGLVPTPDNFGRLGERPTHPELLDFLAAEFVASGWSVKHLHRLILTSAAYQMSTRYDAAAFQADPDNRLSWRFNRRRLTAEELRDGMLAIAELLDRKPGGTRLTTKNREYVNNTGGRGFNDFAAPCRSVYLPVIRSGLFDVFQANDFPDPSTPAGLRPQTTVPAQALFHLNSRVADQAAEAFAKSLLALKGDDEGRIREAYSRAYTRQPTATESARARKFLASSEGEKLKAWQSLCRVLLASAEFTFVE